MQTVIKHDIALFDFIRGWAAVFVFFHHAAILGGMGGILAGHLGKEAVNAFMLASGFLIYFQCCINRSYESLQSARGLKRFAIRRYFRIAPAYYVCLVLALLLSQYLGEAREAIAKVLPSTATSMDRYYIENPIESFFIHASFMFGLIPSHAFSTPLPDWSLGLEAQFYVLFPLIFFFYKKNFLLYLSLSLVAMIGLSLLVARLGISFPMPSFLPLKFHNFAAGMVLAHVLLNPKNVLSNMLALLVASAFLLLGNRNLLMMILLWASWWWICVANTSSGFIAIRLANRLIDNKLSKFLAETSYSVYIFHLIIMIPFYALILSDGRISGPYWLLSASALFVVVMLIALLIYKYIEVPGINVGKRLIARAVR